MMTQRALVVYSTRTGSTREIAEEIGKSLNGRGIETKVSDAVAAGEIVSYDLVIVGSPIYGGMLREDILTFLESHELDLMEKRVAMFTVGMLSVNSASEAKGEHEGAIEHGCMRAPGVKTVSHAIFAGSYDPDKVDFVSRNLMERKGAPIGDFRDWSAIRAWAVGLVEQLAA